MRAHAAIFAGALQLSARAFGKALKSMRLPKRENVRYFDDGPSAEQAGFRPCKRCRPDNDRLVDLRLAAVAEACRRIEAAETPPSLDDWPRSPATAPISV